MSRKVSAITNRTDSTKVTLLTVPTKNTGLWQVMYVASITGTDSPSVYWYDSSTSTEYYVTGGKNLGAGDYVLLNNAEVVLSAGDEIRVKNSGTQTVTYIATVEFVPETAVQFQF